MIRGTPDEVADNILAVREEVGDFDTLLYAGKDWAEMELGRCSMVVLAEECIPEILY